MMIIDQYNQEVDALPEIHQTGGGGEARNASGLVYENLITRTCENLGLDPKKDDYLVYDKPDVELVLTDYPIYPLPEAFEKGTVKDPDNLQVDWHIYRKGLLKFFVESKCYLDSDYLLRAITNLIQIYNSPDNKNPSDKEYGIVAGQNAAAADKLKLYSDRFYKETGKRVNIFFLNPQKTRNSSKPIFNAQYRRDFDLDMGVYNKFIEWLQM